LALDVYEVWDPFYGEPMMVFALTLDGGCNPLLLLTPCEDLKEEITFTAKGLEKNLTFVTDDNVTWTGNMDRYSGAEPADGTTFIVAGQIRFSRLGIAPGDALTDWYVRGYAGETEADRMPQGLWPGIPDPLEAAYAADEYIARFPDYYGALAFASASVDLSSNPNVKSIVKLTVSNPLQDDQDFALDALALAGVEARFVDPADDEEKVGIDITVPGNDSVEISVALYGKTPGAGGDLTVRALTSMGGVNFDSIRVEVDHVPAPPVTSTATHTVTNTVTSAPTGGGSSTAPSSDEESEDSPAIGLVVGAVALLGLAFVVARRRL
jgi:hypothetical protein